MQKGQYYLYPSASYHRTVLIDTLISLMILPYFNHYVLRGWLTVTTPELSYVLCELENIFSNSVQSKTSSGPMVTRIQTEHKE